MAARADDAASSRVGGEGAAQPLTPHPGGDRMPRSSPPLKRKRTEAAGHAPDAEEEEERAGGASAKQPKLGGASAKQPKLGGASAKQPKLGGAFAADLEKDLFGESEIESAASAFCSDEDEEVAAKEVEARRPAERDGAAAISGAGGGGRPEKAPEDERSESGGGGGGRRRDGSEKPSDAEDNAVPDGVTQGDVNLAELFGSDEEEVSGPDEAEEPRSPEVVRHVTEYQLADLGAPNLEDNKLHFMRLPKFISVAAKGFDEDTYEAEPAAEAEEQRRLDRFLLEQTIRYRVQGGQRAESNARFVRWSDGSLSLLLGSEMFDLTQEDYKSQKQYLAVDHPGEHILQVQAKFTDSLKFAQHPISGTYAALSAAVEDSNKRRGGIKLIQTLVDPELEKLQAQQREAERLKARRRLEGARRRTSSRYSRDSGALNERALEAESDEDDSGRTPRATRGSEALDGYHEDGGFVVEDDAADDEGDSGNDDGGEYRDDEDNDEEEEEEERTRRIMRAKRGEGSGGRRKPTAVDSEDDG